MNLSSANVEYPKKRRLFEELLKIKDLYKKKMNFIYVIRVNVLIFI